MMQFSEKINCLMVVNGFLRNAKFNELYDLLSEAAKKNNISLNVISNDVILADTSLYRINDRYDCCIFWDKDLILASYLENMGLRLYNRAESIRLCDDKALTHLVLMEHKIKTPRTVFAPMTYPNIGYTNTNFLDIVEERLGYPIVVKERKGSFGMQVYLADDRAHLDRLVNEHGMNGLIFQELIKTSYGVDVRVNMTGENFSAAMKRQGSYNDFRSNISIGGTMSKYQPGDEELEICANVMRALKLDYAGIDLLFSDDGVPYVCEVNSNAHFKNIYDCTGVNCAGLLMEYIRNDIKRVKSL